MIKKRHQIVEHDLMKYPVAEDVYAILDRLSYKEFSSQLLDWELFTRRNGSNEFVAIYGNREFLVEGPYSTIDVPQRDLENITQYVFNENWISRKIRRSKDTSSFMVRVGSMLIPPFALGILSYGLSNKSVEVFESMDLSTSLLIMVGGMMVVGIGFVVAENLLNRYYGSKLSRDAENYNYGRTAEDRLRQEFIFERIKSGKLGKQDFLKLRGYEV